MRTPILRCEKRFPRPPYSGLRFHALQLTVFLEGELAGFRRAGGICGRRLRAGRLAGNFGGLAGCRFRGAPFLFKVVVVIANAMVDFAVALERKDVRADAVQKITVVTHDTHHSWKRIVQPLLQAPAKWAGRDRWCDGFVENREIARRFSKCAPAADGCARRRKVFSRA